jgi:hypothetical protein
MSVHADRVRQAADMADQARHAAAGMDLGGGAFGVMCSFLVPPLQLLSFPAISLLTQLAETVEAGGDAFQSAAEMFARNESDAVELIERETGSLW